MSNKRDIKRRAYRIVVRLIESYMDHGQPHVDHGCEGDCPECDALADALLAIRDQLENRGFPSISTTTGKRNDK